MGGGYANFMGEGLRQLHGRGVWGREVPPWGCGDSKEFAFCGSVSAEPRLKGRVTLASPLGSHTNESMPHHIETRR